MTYPVASCDTITAFQMLVIRYGISISIRHVLRAAPLLRILTSAVNPLLQVSVAANSACKPVAEVGISAAAGASTAALSAVAAGASSSVIVAVPVPRAMMAPLALVSTTVNCSFGSSILSGVTGIAIVLVCSPGTKLTEPLVGVKSALVAVPATVWKFTVI